MLLGTQGNKRLYSTSFKIGIILLLLSSLFACSNKELPLEHEPYILEINDEEIPTNEIMVYMYQVVEEFQNIGGKEVWEFEDFSGGKRAKEVAKDAIIENIIRMKVLNDKSVELNINLDSDEIVKVKQGAADYLKDMPSEFISENNISLELMENLFYKFAVAEKVIEDITNDYNPAEELIEEKMLENEEYRRLKEYETLDLLTEYNVSHILLRTREKNQSGVYVTLTEADKKLKYNKALEILEKAKDGQDFDTLMHNYSEETFEIKLEDNGRYTFSKALLPEEFKDGLVGLEAGQISEIIESESGYHIFKVNSIETPSDEAIKSFEDNLLLYANNLRVSVIENLKRDAFNELYLKWKESVDISVDRDEWDIIDLQIYD